MSKLWLPGEPLLPVYSIRNWGDQWVRNVPAPFANGGGGQGGGGGGQALAAPTNLAATPASSSQINLTWTDNATADGGYKVEHALSSSGPWTQVGTTAANATSYSDTGLDPSTQYFYRVRAFKGGRNGPYSGLANATTQSAQFSVPYTANLLQQMYSDQLIFQDTGLTTPATANDDPVGGWASTTADKPLIQVGVAGTRPLLKTNQINGFPSVRFDGSNDFLRALFTLARPWHCFMVVKQISWTSGDVVLCGGTTDAMAMLQFGSTPELVGYNGNTIGGWNNNAAVGAWKVVEFLGTAATSKIRVNNTTATTPDPASASALGGVTLGANQNGSQPANIELAAFLLYDADIGSTNRDTVVNALATRYGITL